MTDPNKLIAINGADPVAQLAEKRAAEQAETQALQAERLRLLGDKASAGSVYMSPEVAREVAEQAKVNTGKVPAIQA